MAAEMKGETVVNKLRRFFARRKRLAFVGCTVIVFGATVFIWHDRSIPRYKGKTAAEWFAEFRTGRIRHQIPFHATLMNGKHQWGQRLDLDGMINDPSGEPLRAMGADAALWLGKQVRRGDSAWSRRYFELWMKMPKYLTRVLPGALSSRDGIRYDAALALAAMGSNASPALPFLVDTLSVEEPQSFVFGGVVEALQRLSYDPKVLDQVLADLSRRRRFDQVVEIISRLRPGSACAVEALAMAICGANSTTQNRACLEANRFQNHASLLVPALASAFKNSDPRVSGVAAATLQQFGHATAASLPVFIEALRAPDSETRYHAARILEVMGSRAVPALPVLKEASVLDSNEMVRRVAGRIVVNLQSIPADESMSLNSPG